MSSTVEKLSPSRVKLTVTITAEELKPHLEAAYREIAQQVNLPGFRPGKVPPAIINQRFGKGIVLQEALNAALPEIYNNAIAESGEVPLGDPEINFEEVKPDTDVVFTAEVDVRPEFDLPKLEELQVTVPVAETKEEDVDERVEMLRKRFATTKEVKRAAKKGDLLVIDLEGSKDGEKLEDASAEGITYRVGDEGMLDGLEKAVKGLKAGESATFESELVGGKHQGEKCDITVTVQKVQEEKLPEVDDDFAQLVSEFDTVAEMREDLTKAVARMAKMEQINGARDKAMEVLVAAVDFEAPENIVEREYESRKTDIEADLGRMGTSLTDYLKTAELEAETEDEFWAGLKKNINTGVKAQIILDKFAEEHEVEVKQEDFAQLLYRRAMQNGTTPEQEMQNMMQNNQMGLWTQELRRNKALEEVLGKMQIVDEAGEKVTLGLED